MSPSAINSRAPRAHSDVIKQGIAAARAGGMYAVGITTGHTAEALIGAHLIVDSLAELSPTILAELAQSSRAT